MNLHILEIFSKNTHISNFMKLGPVGAEFSTQERRAGGRTDGRKERYNKANSPFSQFCKRG